MRCRHCEERVLRYIQIQGLITGYCVVVEMPSMLYPLIYTIGLNFTRDDMELWF